MVNFKTYLQGIKPAKLFIWLALFFAAIKNVEFIHGWEITYGHYDHPFYLNNLIYFVGNDFMVLCLALSADVQSKSIISRVFVGLAIGKILDEFTNPFNYAWPEMIWDLTILIWAIIKWNRKAKGT